jgi:outer membrane protein assembly factor BamA
MLHMPGRRALSALFCLWCCCVPFLSAQQTARSVRYEINEIRFDGNTSLSSSQLMKQMGSKETPGFINKFLHSISEQLGGGDELFDRDMLGKDLRNLRIYYEDKGFLYVAIDTATTVNTDDQSIDILFKISEGYRSRIDSIDLVGIVGVPWFAIEDLRSSPRIEKGDPFDRAVIESEADRILNIMRNAGYARARFQNDSSGAYLDPVTQDFLVRLSFDLGQAYQWGTTEVHQERTSGRDDVDDDIILQQLDLQAGSHFSQDELSKSERNLNRLGIFERAQVEVSLVDSTAKANTLVSVRPRDKHEVAPEVLVSDEFGDFNLGVGVGYTNRNFYGGARIFSTRLRFRTQTLGAFPDFFGTDTRSIANFDLTFELQQPYVFSNDIKGTWSFSYIKDKRQSYREDILRNKFGFTDQFATYSTAFLDWTLERTSLKLNDGVSDTVLTSDAELARASLLGLTSQFNSILSLTLQRDKSFPAFSPVRGFFHTATFDEAGLLPLLLKSAQPNLSFTQFYRVILVGRWYLDITDNGFSIFAMKLKSGFEEKYGESRSDATRQIPTSYRFYGGGGGSIRGWGARKLSAAGNPEFGGNLSMEASFELRTNILRGLKNEVLNKLWLVTFLDMGNVWPQVSDAQIRTVAMALGLGIRYDTFFGPFRLDLGTRLYDPREMSGRKWITERPFQIGALHFGIGHAF